MLSNELCKLLADGRVTPNEKVVLLFLAATGQDHISEHECMHLLRIAGHEVTTTMRLLKVRKAAKLVDGLPDVYKITVPLTVPEQETLEAEPEADGDVAGPPRPVYVDKTPASILRKQRKT